MKAWLRHGVFLRTLGRIWGAAALAFLASLIPMYLWRGSYHGSRETARFIEDIIMTCVGLGCGFWFLLLLQSKRKDTLYRSKEEICLDAAGGVVIYLVGWTVMHLCTKNNYGIAFCGYHLACLLGVDAKDRPTVLASVLAALIYGVAYYAALLLGSRLAHRHAQKIFENLQNVEE